MQSASRAAVVVAIILASTACKRDEAKLPVTKVAAPKAVAAAAPPPAANAFEAVPLTDSTLSVLEPREGKCVWLRFDPVAGKRHVIAAIPGADCAVGHVAWSPDGARALLWFGHAGTSAEEIAIHRIEVASGQETALPKPTLDRPGKVSLEDLGLDAQGAPIALFLETLTKEEIAKGEIAVDGKTLNLNTEAEGSPALAHAARFVSGKWERFETKPTTEGADYSAGVLALEASHALGPRTTEILVARFQGDAVDSPEVQAALAPFVPKTSPENEGGWVLVGTPGGRAYVWEQAAEIPFTSGPVVFADSKYQEAPGVGFGPKDPVVVRTEGSILLVTSMVENGGRPRLYDLGRRKLVWSSETARATVFWPRAHTPAHD